MTPSKSNWQVYEKKREKKETSARWKYDLGWKRNFEQVYFDFLYHRNVRSIFFSYKVTHVACFIWFSFLTPSIKCMPIKVLYETAFIHYFLRRQSTNLVTEICLSNLLIKSAIWKLKSTFAIYNLLFQVFGTKKRLWFLPVFSKDDLDNLPSLQGTYFPMRDDVES